MTVGVFEKSSYEIPRPHILNQESLVKTYNIKDLNCPSWHQLVQRLPQDSTTLLILDSFSTHEESMNDDACLQNQVCFHSNGSCPLQLQFLLFFQEFSLISLHFCLGLLHCQGFPGLPGASCPLIFFPVLYFSNLLPVPYFHSETAASVILS